MIKRRLFIQAPLLVCGGALLNRPLFAKQNNDHKRYMPDESYPHAATWMAFVASDFIWSKRQVPAVKKNLAAIAKTIARYEPVSMLVNAYDVQQAQQMLHDEPSRFPITLHRFPVDDLWLRDTGPTFVHDDAGEVLAIDFNFNGWGNKQAHKQDKHVARFVAKQTNTLLTQSDLVLEGGCFEVDGHGTAIMTKSCIINDNRNPHKSQEEIEASLKNSLGLRKIIWLEGIKGRDITDGHTDFYARFVKPSVVVVSRDNYRASYDYQVTRDNIATLSNSTDADGNPLQLHIIDTPDRINEHFGTKAFAAGYIGYYVCNGAVIVQKFGDEKADKQAKTTLQALFPQHAIEQIAIDGIASGGGSIHCATQQQIRASGLSKVSSTSR